MHDATQSAVLAVGLSLSVSPSVCLSVYLSVCLSVCYTRVSYQNGCRYRQTFFSAW